MSKTSRKKSRSRRNNKKKNTEEKNTEEFRFIAYIREDDARDFSGVLCEMMSITILRVKYKMFEFEKVMYTQIIVYVKEQHLKRAYDIFERQRLKSVGSRYFYIPKCLARRSSFVSDKGLCVVGCIEKDALEQFKGDAQESSALSNSEIFFYKIPNSLSVMVEVYTNNINHEFAIEVLEGG